MIPKGVIKSSKSKDRKHKRKRTKGPPKYNNPPIWAKFGFQVDYDVAN
jgi:hypothetical protein